MTPRDHLFMVLRSIPHREWADRHPVDARKIDLEMRGIRRPFPASAYARGLVGLARAFPPSPAPPDVAYSIFEGLGGMVASASAFAVDSPSAQAFRNAGGKWIAVQLCDPATHDANVAEVVAAGWATKWRSAGVKVLGWHRVEHTESQILIPVGIFEGWVLNAETPAEMELMETQARSMRSSYPMWPLAFATLGKQTLFPTGLCESLDAHLLPECFPEEGDNSDTVAASVDFWTRSGVSKHRLHPMILFSDAVQRIPHLHAEVAEQVGVTGMSAFVAESTPAAAWAAMA